MKRLLVLALFLPLVLAAEPPKQTDWLVSARQPASDRDRQGGSARPA